MINGKIIENKILLHTAQWYITHTCNITCSHCLSFNNYAIGGHSKVENNLEYARQWNKLVVIKDFTIVGGEVFTHTDLDSWVLGLRNIFRDIKNFKVITNGTLLEKYSSSFDKWFEQDVIIEISFKKSNDYKTLLKILSQYKNVDIKKHFNYDEAIYIDGKLRFLIEHCDSHIPWGIEKQTDEIYEFYNNDSKAAHDKCWQKYCHYFYEGKLYKCGTIVGAQEFIKKYKTKENIKSLIQGYRPIDPMSNKLQKDIERLNNEIPQCSLCPVNNNYKKITFTQKKILP